ncbi:MAG: HAD-IA family hydrolase [Bdellovibrionales bacterium]|nr:HAD-IA family hydrolase [Bdellovibrionales bacterium]
MIDLTSLDAIFFDADDTLYEVNGTIGERYSPHLQAHGYDISPNEINKIVPIAWKRIHGTYENYEGGHLTSHERDRKVWEQFVGNVIQELTGQFPHDQLFQDIYDEFGKAHSRTLRPHIESLLESLKDAGLILGVLTNNDRRIHNLLPELGLDVHFDHIFCAADIGFKKPSKKVFDGVASRIGVPNEKILYIGDCPKNDIGGGLGAGWKVLWYQSEGLPKPEADEISGSVPRVRCFSEILSSLKQ